MKIGVHIVLSCIILLASSCSEEPIENHNVKNTTENKSPENFRNKILSFVESYSVDYDTITLIGTHYTGAGTLNPTNHIWRKHLVFKSKQLIEREGWDPSPRRFSMKSYQYADSASCGKAFRIWLSEYDFNADPIAFVRDDGWFKPEPTYAIKTDKEIVILQSYCELIDEEWHKTKLLLRNEIDNIQYTMKFGCKSPLIIWTKK